ncbi:CCAAT/enhancer-binding protein delta-like [Corticium candelabrum]|uniref:CCAAT/enhancer-binding protein delta-like n=1 Tax=Corticium candelabrum TaxID=121492 RepID=UPI002E2704BD|nr:CCAAT/enhancer-binding protein delta-like [Corticium candelabrum]
MAHQGHSYFDFYPEDREEDKKELLLLPVSSHTACSISNNSTNSADFSSLLATETAVDLSALLDPSSNQEAVAANQELFDELFRQPGMNSRSRSPNLMQLHAPKMEPIPTSRSDHQLHRNGLNMQQFSNQTMLSFESTAVSTKTTPTPSSMLDISSVGSGDQASRKTAAGSKRRWQTMDKTSEEYRKRRERNNVAVKKSREKSRQRTVQTENRVSELTQENQRLHARIALLTKELEVLKSLFASHPVSGAQGKELSPLVRRADQDS